MDNNELADLATDVVSDSIESLSEHFPTTALVLASFYFGPAFFILSIQKYFDWRWKILGTALLMALVIYSALLGVAVAFGALIEWVYGRAKVRCSNPTETARLEKLFIWFIIVFICILIFCAIIVLALASKGLIAHYWPDYVWKIPQ